MVNLLQTTAGKFNNIVSTRKFLVFILVFFVLSASWIAVSGRFPMAFDEGTHLGTIQFYAIDPNPFTSNQPAQYSQYGLIVHDPSYLYHYLMSFPWRLITSVTSNFMTQIIFMRLISVAMFAGAVYIFSKVLRRAKFSQKVTNFVLLLFVLTPLVPQVAAQINYDSLFILGLAVCIMLLQDAVNHLRVHSWDIKKILLLISFSLLACLVKYTFLPFLLAIGLFLAFELILAWRRQPKFISEIRQSFINLGRKKGLALAVLVVISFGLFSQRFIYNQIHYSRYAPTCQQVLGESECLKNDVVKRGYDYLANKPETARYNAWEFTLYWIRHMGHNLMFALNGPDSAHKVGYPLFLPAWGSIIFGLTGLVLVVLFWREVFASSSVRLFGLLILLYSGALWVTNYNGYIKYGWPVAVQGRYLIPVLVLAIAIVCLGYRELFKHLPQIRGTLISVAVVCFMAGGGALTFILRSDPTWYWDNKFVISMNENAQKVLNPIIPK